MNRNEFSSLLVIQREANNIGKNELCRSADFTFLQLQRIESAGNNYNMGLAFRYLAVVKSNVYLRKGKKEWCLTEYNQIPKWLAKARDGKFSLRKLAIAADCSYSAVTNVEHGKTVISIDLFLKIVEVLGYNIEIKSMTANGE